MMKVGNVKTMVLPAAGIGLGMVAAPKVTAAHPTLAKYPWLVPLILVFVALILMRYRAARGLALGLGAVAFVFLFQAVYSQVTGKVTSAQAANDRHYVSPLDEEFWTGRIGRQDI